MDSRFKTVTQSRRKWTVIEDCNREMMRGRNTTVVLLSSWYFTVSLHLQRLGSVREDRRCTATFAYDLHVTWTKLQDIQLALISILLLSSGLQASSSRPLAFCYYCNYSDSLRIFLQTLWIRMVSSRTLIAPKYQCIHIP